MNDIFSEEFKKSFIELCNAIDRFGRFVIMHYVVCGLLTNRSPELIEKDINNFFEKYNREHRDSRIYFITGDEDAERS